MEHVLKITLGLHIISGILSLGCGLIAVLTKKGSNLHRKAGRIFFYAMLGVCFSAIIISLAKCNRFLLLIGIFAFYQNYAGWKAVKDKSLKPNNLDWLILIIATLNSVYMICTLDMILVIFGGIGLFGAAGHWRAVIALRRGKVLPPLSWLKMHIGMMMGAYIATVTAFLVVNYKVFAFLNLPNWVFWILPSAILSPLIAYWMRKYTAKAV